MDQEKINNIKYVMIGAVIIILVGYGAGIVLAKSYPLLAKLIKYSVMGIGMLGMAGGVVYLVAGDSFKKKKMDETPVDYNEQLKQHELQIKLMQMKTQLKFEEARQKEIDNKLKMQEARINQVNKSGQVNTGTKRDLLDSMSDLVKPQQQSNSNNVNNDMLTRLGGVVNSSRPQGDIYDNASIVMRESQVRRPQRPIQRRPMHQQRQPVSSMPTPPRDLNDFSEFEDYRITAKKLRKQNDEGYF